MLHTKFKANSSFHGNVNWKLTRYINIWVKVELCIKLKMIIHLQPIHGGNKPCIPTLNPSMTVT